VSHREAARTRWVLTGLGERVTGPGTLMCIGQGIFNESDLYESDLYESDLYESGLYMNRISI
jgi:hypothetical protein